VASNPGATFFVWRRRNGQNLTKAGREMQTKAQIMDAAGMQRSMTRMAHEILERNKGLNGVMLLGIETRGAVLADRIADKLLDIEGIRPEVHHMNPRPYRDDVAVQNGARPPMAGVQIQDKIVVLVDDVLYTGRTVRAALDGIMATGRAKMVQLAALVDRGHRELPIRADYVGKNVPTSRDEAIAVHFSEVDGDDGVWIVAKDSDKEPNLR
jgi:pyrimidine operon attenuation protein / uracil phosphoribosyltransferase